MKDASDSGNLVENNATGEALNLGIGAGTTVEVVGTSGAIGDITGASAADSTFVVEGSSVSAGKVSNVTFLLDPSGMTVETATNIGVGLGDRSVYYVAGAYNSAWTAEAAKDWGLEVLNSIGVTGNNIDDSLNWTNAKVGSQAIDSILMVRDSTSIGAGTGIILDGSKTNAQNDALLDGSFGAHFTAGSLLVIDSEALDGAAALTIDAAHTNKTATIDDNASLYIVNAQVDKPVDILSGFTDGVNATAGKGWEKNWTTGNRVLNAAGEVTVGTDGVTYEIDSDDIDVASIFDDGRMSRDTASALNRFYGKNSDGLGGTSVNYFDPYSDNAGIKFVSRATGENFLDTGNNDRQIVTTLEGAQAMAATAGVQTTAYSIANTLTDNYNARLSYLRDTAPAAGSGEAGTVGIWINPFYNSTDVDGVRIGRHSAEHEFNYGGATIGVDSNLNENFRLGVAFSVGGGETESQGHRFNKTDSDFDFWGLGVYGSYTNGMFGLTGDISYSNNSYDIDQRLPGIMGMNKLTADVDTDTFTVGLTGEYRFLTGGNLNIIPHLGLRYTNLKTDAYRVREKGVGNVFRISSETQNIWTIPLGVTFTGEVATSSDWVIQPKADLGVIFATGDLDADSKFRINGANYSGTTTADDVIDNVTFNGLIGLKAENCDGFSLGLDYNFKASDNLTSHGVTGTIRYDF